MGKFSLGKKMEISLPKMLLVEGQDEGHLFAKLLEHLSLADQIHVASFDGIKKLTTALRTLIMNTGHERLNALGVVRDAELDADGAFQSVCHSLHEAGLPVPNAPLNMVRGDVGVGVAILPVGKPCGKLEDVCLESVADDPAMPCVEDFFRCVEAALPPTIRTTDPSKTRVRYFLTSRELLEEAHFEFLQANIEQWVPSLPNAPSVEKVHAFLASRYNPDLALGIAASEGYWNLDHRAFDEIKAFLRAL
jgi:hypothetical protein